VRLARSRTGACGKNPCEKVLGQEAWDAQGAVGGVAECAGDIRSQVANGLAEIQEILFEVERVEELLNTGTIAVDPAAFQLVLATAMRVSSINVRHRVEAGETGLQETLDEVEQLERSLLRGKGIDADHSEIGESS